MTPTKCKVTFTLFALCPLISILCVSLLISGEILTQVSCLAARMLISHYITSGLKILADAVTRQPPLAQNQMFQQLFFSFFPSYLLPFPVLQTSSVGCTVGKSFRRLTAALQHVRITGLTRARSRGPAWNACRMQRGSERVFGSS